MKILRLIDNLDVRDGGPPTGIRELDRVLRARGHTVVTLAMSKQGEILEPLTSDDRVFRAVRVAGRSVSWSFARQVLAEARSADVLVMHSFYLWHNLVGWYASILCKRPLVLQPHGVFEPYQREHSRVSKALFDFVVGRKIRQRISAVAVASTSEAAGLSGFWSPRTVRVVGVGVHFAEPPNPPRRLNSPVRLMSLSRIAHKKRIDVSLSALALLRARGLDCVLTIAGSGSRELVEQLKNHARDLGVDNVVTWTGHIAGTEKQCLFDESDLLLLPSENENFAVSVAESLAAGVPVVVTSSVAMSQVVALGGGRVVASPDAGLVAEAVMDLTTSSSIYLETSVMARRLAKEHLSWDATAAAWESVLMDVTAGVK